MINPIIYTSLGIFIFTIITNWFLFKFTKDTSAKFSSLFIGFYLVYFIDNNLLPLTWYVTYNSIIIFVQAISVFFLTKYFIHYIKSYLSERGFNFENRICNFIIKKNLILKWYSPIISISFFLSIFPHNPYNNVGVHLLKSINLITALLPILVFLIILIYCIKHKLYNKTGYKYFFIANLICTVSFIAAFFFSLYDRSNVILGNSDIAASILFSIFISIATSEKINLLTKEKENAQEKALEVLELKVKERTIEVVKQKEIVEKKQKEILDSIEYALRIQTAILPPHKIIKQYLENSFILYKPKDIVAGDFYWMETVNDLVLFAACDCTGHGVPGALVSVVCHNALNRAVREFGLTQPAAILDMTAEIVIENFSKSEEDIKDGMDISLCAYNSKTKIVQWAGANNPLWLLQNGELIETKADKQPIGINENSKRFTNHTFNLNATDTIYIFTDGFADQFGGETGDKKLTKRRFKDLLLSVQNKSLQEQGIALDKFITEYRKSVEQIDDILVMGVKV